MQPFFRYLATDAPTAGADASAEASPPPAATVSPSEAAPPPAPAPPAEPMRTRLSRDAARNALRAAYRTTPPREAPPQPQVEGNERNPSETEAKPVSLPQTPPTPPAGATERSPAPVEASGTQTGASPTPPERATESGAGPEGQADVSAQPAATETAEPPPAPPEPAKSGRPPLPEEFQREISVLGTRAPALRRTLARIWNDPSLSEVGRIQKMAEKVVEAKTAPAPETPRDRARTAAREGRYEDLAEATLEEERQEQERQRAFALASEIIADTLDLDPEDPEYLAAGSAQELAQVVERKSRRVLDPVERALTQLRTEKDGELQRVRDEYEGKLKEQERAWQGKLEVAVAEATAHARAGIPVPPRAGPGEPGDGAPNPIPSGNYSDIIRQRRSLIAAGYRQSEQRRN